jgi:hypothetical protein
VLGLGLLDGKGEDMSLKTKLTLLVAAVGTIYATLTFQSGRHPDLGVLAWTTKITWWLWIAVLAFIHYGWRMPLLSKLASSPNLRGTWRFDSAEITDNAGLRTKYSGYLTVKQSEMDVDLRVIWSGLDVTALHAKAPTAANANKLCFAGTYVNDHSGADTGFVAYFTAPHTNTGRTILRYRTDDGDTGEFTAVSRVPRIFRDHDDAQKNYARPVASWRRVWFALQWM